MDFGNYNCKAHLQDIVLKDKAHDTHATYIDHIYIGNPLITVHF